MSSRSEDSSMPELPMDSAGSSVSTTLQKEYEELLRYAVVTPKVTVPKRTTFKEPESTTTETSGESYEQDTRDAEKEVTGLPSTPRTAPVFKDSGITQRLTKDQVVSKANDTSPEPKDSDESFTSSEVATPDRSAVSPYDNLQGADADLVRMESQLDSWCLDLKRNILAEFMQSKMALHERHKHEIRNEKQRHAAAMNKKQNEMESLKELLYTYEKTMEHKDNIITNMTKAIQKQKERFDMMRRFNTWKIKHVEEKKEAFGTNLARKHHHHVLKCKIWSAWRSVVETRWKEKVEKACQSKAQEVCVKLTDDYEAKLNEANKSLDSARLEVSRLHAEREIYEETMKKAFMRGVCALNLEAMHMFREPGDEDEHGVSHDKERVDGSNDSGSEMIPRSQAPRPSATTHSQSSRPSCISHPPMAGSGTTAGQHGRTINVKAVGRTEFRKDVKTATSGSAPPGASSVSSVLVHRHSGHDATPSIPIRNPQPSQITTGKTGRSKSAAASTLRVHPPPPVKVVH